LPPLLRFLSAAFLASAIDHAKEAARATGEEVGLTEVGIKRRAKVLSNRCSTSPWSVRGRSTNRGMRREVEDQVDNLGREGDNLGRYLPAGLPVSP
jgi:hypothetical protein